MKKVLRWRWARGFFFLCLAGMIGCAGGRTQIKEEAAISKIVPEKKVEPRIPPPPPVSPPPSRGESPAPERPAKMPPLGPAPPPPAIPPPPPAAEPSRGPTFVLNFDNADLYEVIRVMGEMMKINFVIDQRVRGVVNIHTAGRIATEDVFPIFQSILKMNGATAVKRGIFYEILPFGEAKKFAPPVVRDGEKALPDERYAIQIVVPKYIPVAEVSKIIRPFLSDGAELVEHPPSNLLIIGDISSNIRRALDVVGLFDTDLFTDLRVRIYPIVNSDVNEIAKEMERIFTSFEVSLKSGRGIGITFTPITRINSLLVVSSIPHIFEKVEKWLKEIDRLPDSGARVSVFVYYVQNGKAKDLADVLKQVYTQERKGEREKAAPPPPTPAPRGARPAAAPAPPPAVTPLKEEAGFIEGEISIVVDETTNALIIRALQRDYKAILDTIRKLDIYPKQALIEVLLAEVTLDDATQFGLEFSTFSDAFTKGGRAYDYTIGMGGIAQSAAGDFTSGLRYSITSANRIMAAIHASAQESRLKVISSPHILASNNKEAKIQVGSSQPILTNTYTTTATGTPGVVEGTIEYKDTGIILSVTPRISDGGLVTLDLSIEQSDVTTTKLGNLDSVPVFPKKTAKTTLSIMEGQTIVIGGLIQDRKESSTSGVPFLSKIPILGGLFGYQTWGLKKTETVLLMTPHVITDLEQSNAVTREFNEKVGAIRRELERKKGEKKN